MFCEKCGSRFNEGAKFCENCGAVIGSSPPAQGGFPPEEEPKKKRRSKSEQMMAEGKQISRNIYFCTDGKYRWVYELSLLKNPTIFVLVWKILFFIFFAIMVITMGADMLRWGADRILDNLKFMAYFFIGMTVITALGYLLYAAIMGWKYCVIFEMDEKGINHKQMVRQAKKAELLGLITALAGVATQRVSTMGVGVNATRTEMYSEFSKVRKVKAFPRRNLIKVNELLGHNQVYADKEDFDFVLEYITSHCARLT